MLTATGPAKSAANANDPAAEFDAASLDPANRTTVPATTLAAPPLPAPGTYDWPCRNLPPWRVRFRDLEGRILPLRCKRWTCPDCARWLGRRLRRAIQAAVEAHPNLNRFLTLTVPPRARTWSLRRRFEALQSAWRRLVRLLSLAARRCASCRWRRRRRRGCVRCSDLAGPRPGDTPRSSPFLWVRELHQDGTPHHHALVAMFVPVRWLSLAWAACGGGKIVDARLVDAHRAAAYLTKSARDGRVATTAFFPLGFRRYGSGGGVRLSGVHEGSPWFPGRGPRPGEGREPVRNSRTRGIWGTAMRVRRLTTSW